MRANLPITGSRWPPGPGDPTAPGSPTDPEGTATRTASLPLWGANANSSAPTPAPTWSTGQPSAAKGCNPPRGGRRAPLRLRLGSRANRRTSVQARGGRMAGRPRQGVPLPMGCRRARSDHSRRYRESSTRPEQGESCRRHTTSGLGDLHPASGPSCLSM